MPAKSLPVIPEALPPVAEPAGRVSSQPAEVTRKLAAFAANGGGHDERVFSRSSGRSGRETTSHRARPMGLPGLRKVSGFS
jgi:hypothetical protein